jgi:hypothetical protein
MAIASAACAPVRPPVFTPMSFRSELPRVRVYPPLVMRGEVVIMARPIDGYRGEVCLKVMDTDGATWLESCWDTGEPRRVTFHPSRIGKHLVVLAYNTDKGWLSGPEDMADLCVLGEDADCP